MPRPHWAWGGACWTNWDRWSVKIHGFRSHIFPHWIPSFLGQIMANPHLRIHLGVSFNGGFPSHQEYIVTQMLWRLGWFGEPPSWDAPRWLTFAWNPKNSMRDCKICCVVSVFFANCEHTHYWYYLRLIGFLRLPKTCQNRLLKHVLNRSSAICSLASRWLNLNKPQDLERTPQ